MLEILNKYINNALNDYYTLNKQDPRITFVRLLKSDCSYLVVKNKFPFEVFFCNAIKLLLFLTKVSDNQANYTANVQPNFQLQYHLQLTFSLADISLFLVDLFSYKSSFKPLIIEQCLVYQ